MPRIHQLADQYSDEDFRRELYRNLADQGLRYDQDLAEVSGIPVATMSRKIKDPASFTVRQLRKIVAGVRPSPAAALRFMGYTAKDIKRFKEEIA